MIEVFPYGNGFAWRLVSAEGRTQVYRLECYPDPTSANQAAKAYRSSFWFQSSQIDHWMGACI